MPKLSDTQLVILSSAATRNDHAVLPLPETLKAKGGAATACLKSLLKKGFIEERRAKAGDPAWREGERRRYGLIITKAGLDAIGVETDGADNTATKARNGNPGAGAAPSTEPGQSKPGTKRALVIDLLSKPKGATIADLQKATGWLPHTVRAALTGLRKRGHSIDRKKGEDGISVYVTPNAAKPTAQSSGAK